jgi:hypothetical protein
MAAPRRAYATDLSDARWALIEPVLSAWRAARAEAGLGLAGPVRSGQMITVYGQCASAYTLTLLAGSSVVALAAYQVI